MVGEPLGSYGEQQGQRLFCPHRNLSACFVFKSPSGFWRESSTSDSVLVALAPDQLASFRSQLCVLRQEPVGQVWGGSKQQQPFSVFFAGDWTSCDSPEQDPASVS